MSGKRLLTLGSIALSCVFLLGAVTSASAQGRGRGGGGGGGRGPGGGGPGAGRPTGVGVDRGLGTSSERSGGRADVGRANASERSRGRSDAGLERARLAAENARRADKELREHPGIAGGLRVNANDLREQYGAALAANPELTFGQFVAANRLAKNLGGRHPGVTTEAILAGLAEGRSIGRTLQGLGVSSREAKDAEGRAKREIKEMKRRS